MSKKLFLKWVLGAILVASALAFGALIAHAATTPAVSTVPLGTAFTYQGQLQDGGVPANGDYDFQFSLYNAAAGGTQIGTTLTKHAVSVSGGLFTVQLDFGNVFGVNQRFLEIRVRPVGGSFTLLDPRQLLTPAPVAQFALKAQNAALAESAQSVAWTDITGKPAAVTRQIVIPASGMGHSSSASISNTYWGVNVSDTAGAITFVIPKPTDWDDTQPITVTLNFSIPSPPASSGIIQWRLLAGSVKTNSTAENASAGWDSLDFWVTEDAMALNYPAVVGGYFNLMKTQSWTSKYSDAHHTWYFGTNVYTTNDLIENTIWHFGFVRGQAVPNTETYTGNLTVVSAVVSYVSK